MTCLLHIGAYSKEAGPNTKGFSVTVVQKRSFEIPFKTLKRFQEKSLNFFMNFVQMEKNCNFMFKEFILEKAAEGDRFESNF